MQLISLVPTDPTVLQRLGDMYEDTDKSHILAHYKKIMAIANLVFYTYISLFLVDLRR